MTDSLTLAMFNRPYDAADKYGCCWDDPALAVPWPPISPRLIQRDRCWPPAQGLIELVALRLKTQERSPA